MWHIYFLRGVAIFCVPCDAPNTAGFSGHFHKTLILFKIGFIPFGLLSNDQISDFKFCVLI